MHDQGFDLPEEHVVAARALVLAGLSHRASLEGAWLEESEPAGRKDTARAFHALRGWLEAEELTRDLFPRERKLMALPLGEWEPATCGEARSWLEASGTLAWALGRLPQMALDYEQFPRPAVETALGLLEPTLGLLTRALLRPLPSLERQLSRTRLWIWRAETFKAEHSGHTPPAGYTFPEIIELTAELHFMQKELSEPVEKDFGVAGRPYRELPAGRVALLLAQGRARLSALAWLCSQAGPPGA